MDNASSISKIDFTPKLSKQEINALPLIAWDGPIEVLNTIEAMEAVTAELLSESHLGFDTETRPTFKKGQYYPPALVQLATAEKVFLFRICVTQTLEPLKPIFESADILKTGVALKDDVKELQKMEAFQPEGFVDVTELTSKLKIESRGLRALAGLLLDGRISKGAQVSNWAKQELDAKQISYAATDAWVSRELFVQAKLREAQLQDSE